MSRIEGDSSNKGSEERATNEDIAKFILAPPGTHPESAARMEQLERQARRDREGLMTAEQFIASYGKMDLFADIVEQFKDEKTTPATQLTQLYLFEDRLRELPTKRGSMEAENLTHEEIEKVQEQLRQAIETAEHLRE